MPSAARTSSSSGGGSGSGSGGADSGAPTAALASSMLSLLVRSFALLALELVITLGTSSSSQTTLLSPDVNALLAYGEEGDLSRREQRSFYDDDDGGAGGGRDSVNSVLFGERVRGVANEEEHTIRHVDR